MHEHHNSINLTNKMEAIMEEMKANWKEEKFDYKNKMSIVVLKTFKWDILETIMFGLTGELLAIENLFFTSFFISWLQSGTEKWVGFVYALIFWGVFYLQQLNRVKYFFWSNQLGINIRKVLSGLMFKKTLKFSQKSKSISSTGRIVTIVSGELQTIDWGVQMAPYMIIAPITNNCNQLLLVLFKNILYFIVAHYLLLS